MLFYVALFVTCIIVAGGFVYLFRALENVGNDVHQVSVQSIRTRERKRPRERKLATTVNNTPTPWGWKGAEKSNNVVQLRPAAPNVKAPWGWQGNHQPISTHGVNRGVANASSQAKTRDPSVGWPYREEKFDLGGRRYKVTRRMALKPTDLSKASKPWGW